MEYETDFCKVTAIIRSEVLEKVERRLQEHGVTGITVTNVKGYGEYTNFFNREGMTAHARIEIFASAKRAEDIALSIVDAAHSGMVGDGIVAVLPVNKVYRIRHRAAVQPDEL
ncbi:MAG: P-II family nitrogen regulator [Burkholderiales bacterium]